MGRPLILALLILACTNAMASTFIPDSGADEKEARPTLRSVEVNAHGDVHTVDDPVAATRAERKTNRLVEVSDGQPTHAHEVIRQVPASKSNHEKLVPSSAEDPYAGKTASEMISVWLNHKVHPTGFEATKSAQPPSVFKLDDISGPKLKEVNMGTWEMWSLFFGFISLLLGLDITVVKRISSYLQDTRHILSIVFWILATIGFAGAVYLKAGGNVCAEWINGYFMELAMNVDNFFTLTVIFAGWKTPRHIRQKPLQFGMLIAIPCRLGMYAAMKDVVDLGRLPEILLGFLLILFAVVAWLTAGPDTAEAENDNEQEDLGKYLLVTYVGKVIPLTPLYKEEFFFESGKATLLFFVMLCIEVSQALFSMDAVTAKITEIPDVFVAATSSIFGIATIRSLYFIFDLLIAAFHYMQYGVSVILAFLGVKLLFPVALDIPISGFFLLILSVLLVCGILSLAFPADDPREFKESPEAWQRIQEFRERERPQKKKRDLKRFGTCQGLMHTEEVEPVSPTFSERGGSSKAEPASSSGDKGKEPLLPSS